MTEYDRRMDKMPKMPRLSYLLRQAQLANRQQLESVLRAFGLTPSQYMVLSIISEHNEGMFSAALARRLWIAPQSSNEIVASLEKMELIRRVEDTASRRVLRVGVTVKGRALLAKCEKAVDRFEQDFFAAFSAEEEDQFRDMLIALVRSIRERTVADGLGEIGKRPRQTGTAR